MLLPPDLRDGVPDDDIVHFIIQAVEQAPVPNHHFHVNDRGTGQKQYSPKMTLALLIYCYANGKIERATYRDVAAKSGEPGDLMVELKVVLPKTYDEKDEETIRRISEATDTKRDEIRW